MSLAFSISKRRIGLAILISALAISTSRAADSPTPAPFARGELVERVACASDATQTYTLYLPSNWSASKRWPVLYVFDPRGRSRMAAEIFREPAERLGWILLSSDNTRSDGPWEPNVRAIHALWPEPDARGLFADPRRLYSAGFSGGAIAAWIVGLDNPQLAGAIGSSGRFPDGIAKPKKVGFAWFGAAGDLDFNWEPMREIDAFLASLGAPHRFETFSGRHEWLPAPLAADAMEWMEIQAMRQGKRERDAAFLEAFLRREKGRIGELEAAGKPLAAYRRAADLVRSFEGLADTAEMAATARRLDQAAETVAARRAEEDGAVLEKEWAARTAAALHELTNGETPMPVAKLSSALALSELEGRTRELGWLGTTARRIRERLVTQLAFYVPRDMMARKRWGVAATSLEVAVRLAPKNPSAWYDLACVSAQSGRTSRALEALGQAIDNGFRDLAHLDRDTDLDPIRGEERFQELRSKIGAVRKD